MKARLESLYRSCGQYIGATFRAPSSQHIQLALFGLGTILLTAGLLSAAEAQNPQATFNDDRLAESVQVILTFINGSFGALVMVSAGIAAIVSSAFGQYRAALGLLVVAVGSFILRSLVSTWFNDASLQIDDF